jgi:hypothetical protein
MSYYSLTGVIQGIPAAKPAFAQTFVSHTCFHSLQPYSGQSHPVISSHAGARPAHPHVIYPTRAQHQNKKCSSLASFSGWHTFKSFTKNKM